MKLCQSESAVPSKSLLHMDTQRPIESNAVFT